MAVYNLLTRNAFPNDANTPPQESHEGGNAAGIVKIYITRKLADFQIYY